ncbi:MAG: 16S rRNA (adenine(1518)-N(6)/adenine(1519)-N(6))-dimethyltransferase RsmA [Pseudomonadota bacterium]
MSGPPPLREVIEEFDLAAKKSLGQHFLLDLNITAKIARHAEIRPGDFVLEIGPGPGGLTRALLDAGAVVTAVERDARCIEALTALATHYPRRLRVVEGDALTADEGAILGAVAPVKIVANLPYNISTELLIKWLKRGPELWSRMTLMFQKEVADRILAGPGSKTFGRLSVIANAAATPSRGFDLPARAFTPPPKVESTVVIFDTPEEPFSRIAQLERVTGAAFGQRRKMLRASLKSLFGEDLATALDEAGAAPTDRPETLSVKQFKTLASRLEL